jgi:hypothetical protein
LFVSYPIEPTSGWVGVEAEYRKIAARLGVARVRRWYRIYVLGIVVQTLRGAVIRVWVLDKLFGGL